MAGTGLRENLHIDSHHVKKVYFLMWKYSNKKNAWRCKFGKQMESIGKDTDLTISEFRILLILMEIL